jgi:Fe-S-cluster containining protein
MNDILVLPGGFRYQCTGCGSCCRGWNIHVDETSHQNIVTSECFEKLKAECGSELFTRNERDFTLSTARRGSGDCVFLDREALCIIHREGSYDEKPLVCRQFPFKMIRTPGGVFVGMSFFCRSCQRNTGIPVESYEQEMMKWLPMKHCRVAGESGIVIDEGLTVDWQGYLSMEDHITEYISENEDMEGALRKSMIDICTLSLKLRREGVTFAASEHISRLLGESPILPEIEVFRESSLFYTAAVAGVLESSSPEASRANTEAILSGGSLRSGVFGKDISMAKFSQYYRENPCSWKVPHIRRYIEHLVFRKQLLGQEPVLCNLAGILTAHGLLEFYLYLSAYQSGKTSPDMEDLYFSYGFVEKKFAAHTSTMMPFFKVFAEGFLNLLT